MTKPGTSRNYLRGRSKEYRIIDKLRKEGYDIVFRSAGSHSKIDVIAIRQSDKRIKFVQSKPKSMSENARKKIADELNWLNCEFIAEFEVI